jgi:hypothetical protein
LGTLQKHDVSPPQQEEERGEKKNLGRSKKFFIFASKIIDRNHGI